MVSSDHAELGRIPIDELKQLPEFALLPESQQKFLAAYIRNGYDAKAAVVESYPKAKKQESVRVMAVRILQSPGVLMLLSMHFGDDPKDAFCKMVAKAVLRGRISKAQLEAFKLIADVREFRRPWAPRYERKVAEDLAQSRAAVKKRVQRAAKKKAIEKAAETAAAEPPPELMPDFRNL